MPVTPATAKQVEKALNTMQRIKDSEWANVDYQNMLSIKEARDSVLALFKSFLDEDTVNKRYQRYQPLYNQLEGELNLQKNEEALEKQKKELKQQFLALDERSAQLLQTREATNEASKETKKNTAANLVTAVIRTKGVLTNFRKRKQSATKLQNVARQYIKKHESRAEIVATFEDPTHGEQYQKTFDTYIKDQRASDKKFRELTLELEKLIKTMNTMTKDLVLQSSGIEKEIKDIACKVADNLAALANAQEITPDEQQFLNHFQSHTEETATTVNPARALSFLSMTVINSSVGVLLGPLLRAVGIGVEGLHLQDEPKKEQSLSEMTDQLTIQHSDKKQEIEMLASKIQEITQEIQNHQDSYKKTSKENMTELDSKYHNAMDVLLKNKKTLGKFYQKNKDHDSNPYSMSESPMPLSYVLLTKGQQQLETINPLLITDWLQYNVDFEKSNQRLSSEHSSNLIEQLALILKHCELNELQNQLVHQIMANCVRNALIESHPVSATEGSRLFDDTMESLKNTVRQMNVSLNRQGHKFTGVFIQRDDSKLTAQESTFIKILNQVKELPGFKAEDFARSFQVSFNREKTPQELYQSSYQGYTQVEFEGTQLGLQGYITQEFQKRFAEVSKTKDLQKILGELTEDDRIKQFVSYQVCGKIDYIEELVATQADLVAQDEKSVLDYKKYLNSINVDERTIDTYYEDAQAAHKKAEDALLVLSSKDSFMTSADIAERDAENAVALRVNILRELMQALQRGNISEIIGVVQSAGRFIKTDSSDNSNYSLLSRALACFTRILNWLAQCAPFLFTSNAQESKINLAGRNSESFSFVEDDNFNYSSLHSSLTKKSLSLRSDDGQGLDHSYSFSKLADSETFYDTNPVDGQSYTSLLTEQNLLKLQKQLERPSHRSQSTNSDADSEFPPIDVNPYQASEAETVKSIHSSNIVGAERGHTTTTIQLSEALSIAETSDFESVGSTTINSKRVDADDDGSVSSDATNRQDSERQITFSASASASAEITSALDRIRKNPSGNPTKRQP